MRLLVYTLLRLVMILAAAGVLYLLGLRSWALWLLAVVVGAMLSFLVLRPQRDAAAEVLARHDPFREEHRPRFSDAVQGDAAHEDALVDAAERPGAEGGPAGRAGQPAAEHPAAGQAADGQTAAGHVVAAPDSAEAPTRAGSSARDADRQADAGGTPGQRGSDRRAP
ncbi:DUF4229 domain-containing protein [Georgenia sp. TF02-10]|uniref:DUF4229 domain-containing protein n=1 Tax=Georgenia sp. TF02-10 TaxID=2917725 RepID=UPI001FA7DF52|nr:DUF4229 domain-containing protein [Georgenia sp. TF02-10]UNX54430.1 DUF4229 domain-containing protein [Georgenia sp. TF02-10]